MKTIREYSDLSPKQKIVYIKRGVVLSISMGIPLFLMIVGFASVLNSYQPEQEIDYTDIPTINATALEQDIETPDKLEMQVLGLTFLFAGAFYSVVIIGGEIGWYFTEKLNLYTAINLDSAEKRYNKIKDAIEKLEVSK